jgi:hypothetical protein
MVLEHKPAEWRHSFITRVLGHTKDALIYCTIYYCSCHPLVWFDRHGHTPSIKAHLFEFFFVVSVRRTVRTNTSSLTSSFSLVDII